jgi:hypothetical protein
MNTQSIPDPNAPQSAFPYPAGSSTPGTPTGSEQVISKSGPIGKRGPLYVTALTALQLSLAAPIAGPSSKGGDDNTELLIVNVSGAAHVVATSAGALNGIAQQLTMQASMPGLAYRFRAYGGVWYATGPNGGDMAGLGGVAPATGTHSGGTAVTITGSGFTSGSTVTIGGTPATSVVVVSSTQITCVAPAGTVGAATVVVTAADGTATLASGFTYS